MTQTDKSLEETVISLEMGKADFFLKFQNIEEEKGEDLADKMGGLLAEVLDVTKEKALSEMDEIFRVHTGYERRNKLPREVHVRFLKKTTRMEIKREANGLQRERNSYFKTDT